MVFDKDFLDILRKNKLGGSADDFADRLNHFFTALLLFVLAFLVSSKQWGGQAISCWLPFEYSISWSDFTHNYCWSQSTYWVEPNRKVPDNLVERNSRKVWYYQWVPFVLVCVAGTFMIPGMLWRLGQQCSGVNLNEIIRLCYNSDYTDLDKHRSTVNNIGVYLCQTLHLRRSFQHEGCVVKWRHSCGRYLPCLHFGKRFGNYHVVLYTFIKLLYLSNLLAQFWMLKHFLQLDSYFYGYDLVYNLITQHEWIQSGIFPRVTLCDFSIRKLGTLNAQNTVQCILPINMLNEKIFIIVWFWFLLVLLVTTFSLLRWFAWLFIKKKRTFFVRKLLRLNPTIHYDKPRVDKFVQDFLGRDGCFFMRLLSLNAGEVVTSEIMLVLWRHWLQEPRSNMVSDSWADEDGFEKSVTV